MAFFIVLFLFIFLANFNTASFYISNLKTDLTSNSESLFKRLAYCKNQMNDSYISSILACLYTIPAVQRAFFEESDFILKHLDIIDAKDSMKILRSSVIISTAIIFAKMRSLNTILNLKVFYYEALRSEIYWEIGNIESVANFWNILFQSFSPRIKSLFEIQVQSDWFQNQGDKVLLTQYEQLNHITIPVNEYGLKISDYIKTGFYNESLSSKIRDPQIIDGENVSMISVSPKITILNTPEVLVFRLLSTKIDFLTGSLNLNQDEVVLDDELEINGKHYICTAIIEFDDYKKIYQALTRDFGNDNFYRYCDYSVKPYVFSEVSIKKTNFFRMMVIYTIKKSDTIARDYYKYFLDIPDSFIKYFKVCGIKHNLKYGNKFDNGDTKSDGIKKKKRKRMDNEDAANSSAFKSQKISQIYKKNLSNPNTNRIANIDLISNYEFKYESLATNLFIPDYDSEFEEILQDLKN